MRRLVIYCDGGFGNRFNALVSGLIVAKTLDLSPQIVWPVNNWCGASFGELFENELPVVDRELATYTAERERYQYFIVEDRLGLAKAWTSPLHMQTWDEVRAFTSASHDDVFYYTALIPNFIDLAARKEQVHALKLRGDITQRALGFLREASLQPGTYFGVQIRKTDFGGNGADDNNLFELLGKASNKRFFVCSDDKTVEERFKTLPNVSIYSKTAHVEKLVQGSWNEVTSDQSGRLYACNVNRSGQSVLDAVVDLLILSYSQVVQTSNSTFLQTALLMQASR
ncbi:MAG TPA: hypothetical protein VE029_08565 [Rhizobacter sp.]|nr:hypothetical protein [Rhizobacter sp.]